MRFRRQYTVQGTGVIVSDTGPLVFRLSDPPVEITFQNAKAERPYDSNALCIANCDRDIDEDTRAAFDALARGEMPEGAQEAEEVLCAVVESDGTMDALEGTPASFLPQPFRDFVIGVLGELDEAVRRTASASRWRFNSPSGHNPVHAGLAEWSRGDGKWHSMPVTRKIYTWPSVTHGINEDGVGMISGMLEKGEQEPLSYELFREGYQQFTSNPRSALIVCFAAVEVGAKECVHALVPDAAWLLDNAPSPNVLDLVSKYLPTLTANTPDKKYLMPSKSMLRDLKLGMEARNKLIHLGRIPDGKEYLKLLTDVESRHQYLTSMRDILWVLYYNQGFEWAPNHFSLKAQEDLGLFRTVVLGQ